MIVFDTKGRPYFTDDMFLMEADTENGDNWRAVLRSELRDGKDRVQPYYLSAVYNRYDVLSSPSWQVNVTFFGRLHIGCRTFDRKNTKLILEWAKGAA